VRLERQGANALAIAGAARDLLGPGAARYPGLPDDPAHALAARQMRRFGGVLPSTSGTSRPRPLRRRLRLVVHATSCGGVQSSAERRARWGGADCPPGLVRLAPASRTPTTWSPTSRQRSIGPRRVPDR
jgi:cystathionine gamma-lyase